MLLFAGHWAVGQGKGSFHGRLAVDWLRDNNGKRAHLREPFEFIDPNGRNWPIPSGIVVDGASIPKPFWSLIGGPFEEPYLKASVVLDYFCQIRTTHYADVYGAFYDALLASDIAKRRAWVLYRAVKTFGPTWRAGRFDAKCEMLDDYDFGFCTRTAAKPLVDRRSADKASLIQFLTELEGEADPEDITFLRRAFESLPQ
jgi:hypothetical protein